MRKENLTRNGDAPRPDFDSEDKMNILFISNLFSLDVLGGHENLCSQVCRKMVGHGFPLERYAERLEDFLGTAMWRVA